MKRLLFSLTAVLAVSTLLCCGLASAASIVPNHDFEVDSEPDGAPDDWFSGGPVGYVSGDDSDGNGTQSVEATGDGGDWRSSAFAVTPSEELTWSVDYKVASGTTGSIRADLRFFTGVAGDGGTAGGFEGENVHSIDDLSQEAPDVWQTLGPFVVNVPAGTLPPTIQPNFADVRLSAGLFGPDFDGRIQFDRVEVSRVPEPATTGLALIAGLATTMIRRRRNS
jgi:hypothetical protein